jgi:hypothetical protein
MKYILLSLSICCLSACNKQSHGDNLARGVSVEDSQELSPKDLGIEKHRFTASPKAGEVAIFRSSDRSRLDPHQHRTYDQIYWTNGGVAEATVVIAPLSFYLGFPESDIDNKEQAFRDSWRLRAGGYGYDVKNYTFASSAWNHSDVRASGKVVYTKNAVTPSEDLVFEFEMFVLPIEEAKKIHPELAGMEAKIRKGETSLRASYVVHEDAGGGSR